MNDTKAEPNFCQFVWQVSLNTVVCRDCTRYYSLNDKRLYCPRCAKHQNTPERIAATILKFYL